MQAGSLTHRRKGGAGASWGSFPSAKPNSQRASGWSPHCPRAPLLGLHLSRAGQYPLALFSLPSPLSGRRAWRSCHEQCRGGFNLNTAPHNTDGQSPLPRRTNPGICNSVLATQPVCQPPSPPSILPTEMMSILRPRASPYIAFTSLGKGSPQPLPSRALSTPT